MALPFAGAWERLSTRERTYLLVLGVVFFVMATFILLYFRSGALRERETEVAAVRKALDRVYTQGAVYEEKLRAKKAREANIASDRVAFGTLLEEAKVGLEDLTIANEEEQPPVQIGDGLTKRIYEFNLRGVSLETMTKFLAKVESERGRVILTEGLTIRSPSGTEDRLNVDVKLSTWERYEQEDEEDAEGDGP